MKVDSSLKASTLKIDANKSKMSLLSVSGREATLENDQKPGVRFSKMLRGDA